MKKHLSRVLPLYVLLLLFTIFATSDATVRRRDYTIPTTNLELLKPLTPITRKEPQDVYLNLELSYTDLAPDGYTRKVWTANGQYPGPLIHCNRGDRLIINVTNNLKDPATIHWHGIFQLGSTWYDGVGGQTQCPIPAGVSFIYNYTVGEQVGTYWWHSHYLAQYVDGIRGPLIINNPDDPYLGQYDYEYVLTLEDWYHVESHNLVAMRLAQGYEAFNPIPDAGLISGRGQYNCSKAQSGAKCDSNNMPAIYTVTKGKKYRFRIINMSAEAFFFFSIDQHKLKVIEVDGVDIKEIELSVLPIHIGQRFSVIVEASQDSGSYWIRADIPKQCILNRNGTINNNSDIIHNSNITGILRYDDASNDTLPQSNKFNDDWYKKLSPCHDLDINLIKPYEAVAPPQKVTDQFNISIMIYGDSKHTTKAYINGQSWVPDLKNPSIMKIMDQNISATEFPINANAYMYDTEGGAVEIVIYNQNGGDHPFHLHGHNFFIIGMGSSGSPDASQYNLVDPPLRDTVTLPGDGWAVIRYLINNPGVWAFHCHIEWHVELGMVFQLIEMQSKLQQLKMPPSVEALCQPGYQHTKRLAIPFPDDEGTTITPGGYVIPNSKGSTKRLAIPSPDDDNGTTITPGGYVIPNSKEGSTKVKRTTERNIKYTTKRNAWKW
ncbi:multicopper oxidase [Gigaspora rosea]|uniref:Multicopper oxidase n=1 Tax=Gigaspora rosea TaxID=44941 RepID=A0A397UNB0_9GLOM|nr:multicopper oxidase [Gigaspora rosea]